MREIADVAERDNERRDQLVAAGIGDTPAAARADGSPAGPGITVYGAWWCGDTRRSVALLDRLGIGHAYVSVDDDAAANAWATAQNRGQRRIPVVALGSDGPTLIEPSDEALLAGLAQTGYLAGRTGEQPANTAPGTGTTPAC